MKSTTILKYKLNFSLRIIDLSGKVRYVVKPYADFHEFDVAQFAQGLYYVQITSNDFQSDVAKNHCLWTQEAEAFHTPDLFN